METESDLNIFVNQIESLKKLNSKLLEEKRDNKLIIDDLSKKYDNLNDINSKLNNVINENISLGKSIDLYKQNELKNDSLINK